MSAKQEQRQRTEQEFEESQALEAAICAKVMSDLGQPATLHHVQVRLLWGNKYRVNVFVGADAASATVAHSFFLTTDDKGKVLVSIPAITRQY